ncbi:putative PGG domain, ankyrin repeat-containing domain superfamily [Helianthus annuus]|nr:putative PGG domain, ankyrin repeat-containing domain superfamily [Helianthus annuus]KAJ0728848.1 putative PGG domain, ankyrin repeat-containing domain superfamily [Helianthus annuus]KAJ0905136.1 putative ankyrin repeat-containing domain, PGG domain, ankyrin repeat-containing domain superfamily [Helianthus annuus]
MHAQALQLLRFICSEIAKLDGKRVRDLIGSPLEAAATMGNVEVVEEILLSFPNALSLVNENKHGVFQIAIANRRVDVFNIIYQITTPHHLLLAQRDASYNTALHLVARLVGGTTDQASLHLRSCAPGAALQMQRELQWFKVVEKLSRPQDQEQRNIFGKTPAMIFTESHENLAKEGEQWMKDRAHSGIIIATLIATIVFTSAITVPGGTNSDNGKPIFSERTGFVAFAVADALALLMSASSMLMFLGILTARYAVQDFLSSLPKRLIIALITLFLSIIFMMMAFTSVLYLVFGEEKTWVLGLVSSLANIPVLVFAVLQFKPIFDISYSTYGPAIFGKRGDRIIV